MSDANEEIIENLKEPSAWVRIMFMAGFAVVLHLIISPVVIILLLVQAAFSLIAGESNANLRRFGEALSVYVYQILRFISYNDDQKPFPFSDFPPLDPLDETDGEVFDIEPEAEFDTGEDAASDERTENDAEADSADAIDDDPDSPDRH